METIGVAVVRAPLLQQLPVQLQRLQAPLIAVAPNSAGWLAAGTPTNLTTSSLSSVGTREPRRFKGC